MRKWVVKNIDSAAVDTLSKETGLNRLISSVLVSRGIDTREKADCFFNGSGLSDSFLLLDMDKACVLIKSALKSGDKITVYGDYDCDGVTSTVMLYNYLLALGGNVDWYIPSRTEGYGLNIPAVENIIKAGTKLIITVDNGVSAIEEAEYIKEQGISLIITDHHQVPPFLPVADAIINPNREGDISPFKKLAGCGVVLKLIIALEADSDNGSNQNVYDNVLEQFGDLAAIGTIGDIVPVLGENRYIVEHGLKNMLYTENVGLYQLLKQCGYTDDSDRLTSTSLAFTVCPRINAAGRFSHASKAARLLTCENEETAVSKAYELGLLNTKRQEAEAGIMREIDSLLSEKPELLAERVLVITGGNWNHGIIGIISSRLLMRFGKPNIVITTEGDIARGSARSIEGFSLYKLLSNCRDLLIKFGGHTKAAGFSLKTYDIPAFTEQIKHYALLNYPSMPVQTLNVDKELEAGDLTLESVEQLSILAPFGEGNPPPVFLLKNVAIVSKKPLKDGKYVSFDINLGNVRQKVLNFNTTYDNFKYNANDRVDILVSLDINEYNDVKSIQAQVKDVRAANFSEEKFFAAKNTYEKLKRKEAVDIKLLKRIIPEKEQIKKVYDILRNLVKDNDNSKNKDDTDKNAVSLSAVCNISMEQGLNYCMICVILDVFEEFELIKKDIIKESIVMMPAGEKVDLTKSAFLKEISMRAEQTKE